MVLNRRKVQFFHEKCMLSKEIIKKSKIKENEERKY